LVDLLGEDNPEVEKAKLAKAKADEEAEKQFKAWRDGQPLEQKIKWAQKQVANKQRWVDSVHAKCSKIEDKIATLERELEALNPTGARAHQQLAEAEQFLETAMAQLAQALPKAREEPEAATASDPISAMVKLVATMQEGTAHVPKDVQGHAQLQALVAKLRTAMPGLEALAAAPPPAPPPPTTPAEVEEGAEEGKEEADPPSVQPSKRPRGEDRGANDTIEVDEEGGPGDPGQLPAGRGAKGGGGAASSQAPA
jgi:hypothetical protein